MKIMGFVGVGLLSGVALLATTGCGNANQETGTTVTETKEAEDSRAAMQRAIKENPNMVAPPKGAQRQR